MKDKAQITADVEHWLDKIVIGMGFCPFAKQPRQFNRVDIFVSGAGSVETLLMELVEQAAALEQTPNKETETTLLVVPELLADFDAYLDCLYLAEKLFESEGWEGVFQLASFHPEYQFEGTDLQDVENLTNRSPYPIFHILREDSLSAAIESYGDTSDIPERNKKTLSSLSAEQLQKLF